MEAGKKQTALQHQHNGIKSSSKVPYGYLNRVIPEGINNRPGKIIAVVALQIVTQVKQERNFFAKKLVFCISIASVEG